MKKITIGNVRVDAMLEIALRKSYGGGQIVFMDCYNLRLYDDGLTPTITTRVSASCDHYILEVETDTTHSPGSK